MSVSGTAAISRKKVSLSGSGQLSKYYTAFNGVVPTGASATNVGPRNDGITFTVTSTCKLAGIAFYLDSTETDLTGSDYTATLYSTTNGTSGTSIASQVGSGTFTAGAYNWISFSGVTLSPGTTYVASIHCVNLLVFIHNYWGTGGPGVGGITSGPISVPDQAHAPGNVQQGFLTGATAYPGLVNANGSWYGVDVKVAAPISAVAISLKKMRLSGSGKETETGSVAISLKKMSLSSAGTAKLVGSGAISLKKMRLSGSGKETETGSVAISLKKMSLSATGTVTANLAGSGGTSLKKMTVSATSAVKLVGSGAIPLKKMRLSGSGRSKNAGSGNVVLPKMAVAATNFTARESSPMFVFSFR